MPKFAKRVDANQAEIVRELRKRGVSVCVISMLGQGAPDLIAGYKGKTYLLEVKDGNKPLSEQALTGPELVWHQAWNGHVALCRNLTECLYAIGYINK